MKRLVAVAVLALGIAGGAYATDFSSYTTDELLEMRGTVAVEDRDAFRSELQDRLQSMTPEERAAYDIGRNGGTGSGLGIQDRLRDGSGLGGMHQGANRGGRR